MYLERIWTKLALIVFPYSVTQSGGVLVSKEVNVGFGSSNAISLLVSVHALNVRSIIAISNVIALRAKPLDELVGASLNPKAPCV